MRRLLYCLLGSALFHAALLWVPLPMNAGGAGEDDLLLVRVRLVETSKSEAVTGEPRRVERAAETGRVRQARAEPRRVTPEPPRAEPRPAARVARAAPVRSKPVKPVPVRTKPPAEAKARTTPVAAAPARTKAVPEPGRASPVAPSAEAAEPVVEERPVAVMKQPATDGPTSASSHMARAERKPPDTTDGDGRTPGRRLDTGTVRSNREGGSARGIGRGTPAEQVTAGAQFSPVHYARTVRPRYPRKARRAGWEGTTLLKVLVNPDGAAGRVTVERTSGFDILDEAAVKAVRRWRFHPARRGVARLSSWVRIPVAFRLKEGRR